MNEEDEILNLDEAVNQLKSGIHMSEVEKLVDEFFLANLPTEVFRKRRTQLYRSGTGRRESKEIMKSIKSVVSNFNQFHSNMPEDSIKEESDESGSKSSTEKSPIDKKDSSKSKLGEGQIIIPEKKSREFANRRKTSQTSDRNSDIEEMRQAVRKTDAFQENIQTGDFGRWDFRGSHDHDGGFDFGGLQGHDEGDTPIREKKFVQIEMNAGSQNRSRRITQTSSEKRIIQTSLFKPAEVSQPPTPRATMDSSPVDEFVEPREELGFHN